MPLGTVLYENSYYLQTILRLDIFTLIGSRNHKIITVNITTFVVVHVHNKYM